MKLGKPIGEQLLQLRVNLGRSRHEVAERGGINVRVLERLETGMYEDPRWSTIRKALKGLDVVLTASYGSADEETPQHTDDVA